VRRLDPAPPPRSDSAHTGVQSRPPVDRQALEAEGMRACVRASTSDGSAGPRDPYYRSLQAHPIKKAHEMAREKTMPTTLRMSDVTGGKLFYYV
jgi:hypothetical protein